MNKLVKAFLSATLLTSSAFNSTAYAVDPVATYEEEGVTKNVDKETAMEYFKRQVGNKIDIQNKKFEDFTQEEKKQILKLYSTKELLKSDIKQDKIEERENVKTALEAVKEEILIEELFNVRIRNKITDKQISDEYNKRSTELKGQSQVRTSHILVETEEKAKEVKKKLNKGSNFAELANTFSKDERSKAGGGDIGYLIKGQALPEYEAKAFSLKKDEISDPVRTTAGWHIIKLIDKKPVEIPTKEQAEPIIKEIIFNNEKAKYIEEKTKKANIQYKF